MKKFKIVTQPTRLSELSFDDLDYSDEVELKSERWQTKRLRDLKYQ